MYTFLAGGVVVGTSADLVMQPHVACAAGCVAGLVASLWYSILIRAVHRRLGVHDTCGVHNLHGMPGLLGGLVAVVATLLASEDGYGPGLYRLYPHCAPEQGSPELTRVQAVMPGKYSSFWIIRF